MTKEQENSIRDDYFKWLYDTVCRKRVSPYISYIKLFRQLDSIDFVYTIQMDENRMYDGEALRYRYATDQKRYPEHVVKTALAKRGPCSVLEMMVALAVRCEETIMTDTRYGDRTNQWFWDMINSLGLSAMSDDNYDENIVQTAIYKFLDHDYDYNGRGGLFYIRNCHEDMTKLEIWQQLLTYLNGIM